MSEETTYAFDPYQKRPLELRVRDMQDEGGVSDADAVRLGRVAADALVIVRFMADVEKGLSVSLHSLQGSSLQALGLEAHFTAWLSYTGHLARQAEEEGDKKRALFLKHVLGLLRLNEHLDIISSAEPAPETHCAQSGADPSSLD